MKTCALCGNPAKYGGKIGLRCEDHRWMEELPPVEQVKEAIVPVAKPAPAPKVEKGKPVKPVEMSEQRLGIYRILAILGGQLGIHNLYADRYTQAHMQLVAGLIGWGSVIVTKGKIAQDSSPVGIVCFCCLLYTIGTVGLEFLNVDKDGHGRLLR